MFKFQLQNNELGIYELQAAPVGWDSLQYTFKRSKEYHGITIDFTLDLDFLADGRAFIQTVYNTYGIEGFIRVLVFEYNSNTFKWEETYTGRLNLSKVVIGAIKATTNIQAGGISQKVLNLDDVSVNLQSLTSVGGVALPPFEREQEVIGLHSQKIGKVYEAGTKNERKTIDSPAVEESSARGATIIFGFEDIKTNELEAYTYETGFSFEDNIHELFPVKERGPVKIEFLLDATIGSYISNGDYDKIRILYIIQHNNTKHTIKRIDDNKVGRSFSRRMIASGNFNFDLEIGDKVYLYAEIDVSDTRGNYQFYHRVQLHETSFVRVTAQTQTLETTTRGMLVHEFFSRICSFLTDRPDSFYSEHFGRTDSQPRTYAQDGAGSLRAVMPGFWIRNFSTAQKNLYATLKEAYSSFDAIDALGMGIETIEGQQVVRIEKIQHFYQNVSILKLGRVSNLDKKPAAEHFYNEIQVGYEKWQIQDFGGLDEVNSKRKYTAPITQIKNTYSAICKYITAGGLIETIRRSQYIDASTKDNGNDNSNFIICLLRSATGFISERNQNIDITGVASPETRYNAAITPARMLKQHEPKIKGGLLKQLKKNLTFSYGEGNYTAGTQKSGEPTILLENQDKLIEQLAAPLWEAEHYNFDYYLTDSQLKEIRKNPYGFITFEDEDGNYKKGFIDELKRNKFTKKTEFTLLKVPE